MRIVSFVMVLALLLSVLTFGGCRGGGSQRYQAESFAYFDTVTTVIGYAESEKKFLDEVALIFEMLGEYHRLFDIYHAYDGIENLYTVNELQNGVHRTVTVDARIIALLQFAKDMYTKTNGALHIGMGSVLSIWHTHREAALQSPDTPTVPLDAELAAAAAHTSLDHLVIDSENSTVTITDPQMTLDLGAIAKGYAAECAAKELAARGLSHYVLNVGGTVRTVGARADGRAWVVGIEQPAVNTASPYLAEVTVVDRALSTSGSYQRYYMMNGVRYHHIVDPKTNKPATGYLSVSVLAEDTALADALSTALFCMSIEEGTALLNEYPDAAALWVRDDGTQYKSARFDAFLKK
ncbi:MAG: FAD:protein FMN transferase [Ruminococcaceae bacterium]|nr:FAD:protein FMN transferase [Oscillospiraceae bacterium]